MKTYKYSPVTNAFYPYALQSDYEAAGTWPNLGIDMSDSDLSSWQALNAPAGKVRIAGADGHPAWGDIPPPTAEQLAETMELQRQNLQAFADTVTADWRTELALGEISDADKAKLSAWMAYKREVKAAVSAPWPAKPAL